jgi:hypothetical protein
LCVGMVLGFYFLVLEGRVATRNIITRAQWWWV